MIDFFIGFPVVTSEDAGISISLRVFLPVTSVITLALTEDLGDVSEEVEDVNDQVHYWRNYPHIQNIEKKTKVKELKKDIRQVDELYDAFEGKL